MEHRWAFQSTKQALVASLALFLLGLPAEAVERPRIGLVLGGGGARGAAHIGVLEVLERLRVPVDCVAGTSMGSLVAGAYATGLTPAQMKEKLAPVDWRDMFSDNPDSSERSYRKRQQDRRFYPLLELGAKESGIEAVPGAVAGQKIKLFFNDLIGDDRGEHRIEDLRLPLSIIATDIGTGERVVLREGSLSKAMRASMSVPGLLDPVKIGKHTLVDGGLVDNVPIGEVRSRCSPDLVIAIDVGTPLLKPEEVGSVLSVTAQMINILTNQNVVASIRSLQPQDVFIQPDLGDITAGDFPRIEEAVERGRRAAEASAEKLRPLSVSAEQYAVWRSGIETPLPAPPRIDEIEIAAMERVNPVAVKEHLRLKPGDTVDRAKLDQDLLRIYGEGDYQSVDYSLLSSRDRNILRVTPVEKSWGPDYLLFGLNLSSSLSEDSSYEIRGAYRRTWINSYGGEWLLGGQIGRRTGLFAEIYQPLEERRRFFVGSSLGIFRQRLDIYEDNDSIAQYRVDEGQFSLDLGMNLDTLGQARIGWLYRNLDSSLDIGQPDLPTTRKILRGWTATLDLEQFDRLFFPTHGWKTKAEIFDAQSDDYVRGQADLRATQSFGGIVLNARTTAGGALNGTLPFADAVALGGPFKLSGFVQNQIIGGEAYLGSLALEKVIGRMPLGMTGDLRLGVTAEAGKVNQRYTETELDGWLSSYSVYFGGDLPIGPLYLGYGYAPRGTGAFYLYLGTP